VNCTYPSFDTRTAGSGPLVASVIGDLLSGGLVSPKCMQFES
jgi:hypothetical protein